MELRQLRHFLAVYEHQHYSRAAVASNSSQSAITKSVKKLEDSIGAKLFERGRFGAIATEFGHLLAIRAKLMCAEEQTAISEINALKGGATGKLVIGAGLAFVYRLLPEVIVSFGRLNPSVGIDCVTGTSSELFAKLLKGEIDFVVSSPTIDFVIDPELTASTLFQDRDFLVVGAKNILATQAKTSVEDLGKFPWVFSLSAYTVTTQIDLLFRRAGLPTPSKMVRTDSPTLVKRLLASGEYIGVLGHEFFQLEAELGLLRQLNVEAFKLQRRAMITTRHRSPLTKPAVAFIKLLKSKMHGLRVKEVQKAG